MGGPGREDCHEHRRGAPAVASLSAVVLGTGCDPVGTLIRATGSVRHGVWKPGESTAMHAGPIPWPVSRHRDVRGGAGRIIPGQLCGRPPMTRIACRCPSALGYYLARRLRQSSESKCLVKTKKASDGH